MVWAPDPGAIGARVDDLDTPSLLLDLDAVERNLDRMAHRYAGTTTRLRPHTKTHKVPQLALMQLERGAVGVCCAKLGEAEVMASGGVSEILVTTEVVGAAKIRRLLALARQVNVITVVDDAGAAGQLSGAAVEAGLRLRCLVDLNVGQNRAGIEPGEPALHLARAIERLPGLELLGLQGYEGHLQHIVDLQERRAANARAMRLLTQTAALLQDKGMRVDIVSTAGTGTGRFAAEWPQVTELQPGSYVVMDADYGRVQGLDFEQALTVLTSVISRRQHEAIVDAGEKALSSDSGPARPRHLDATYAPQGDEHGKLTFADGNLLALGDKIELIPSHCDTTVNLHDLYYVTRGGRVVAVWPIAARGRVQ
ncbi:MAG: DSD1 family PLP-dependent enzyme [Chloroflexota bacterium]|nr:DSD1 family PLP-dependent enzyme [Chloroflexota bacterium]